MSEVLDLPRIHKLPEQLAHQIAAGEVVERPASVVKELLENAIDARADTVRIDLDRGGIARIRISDNGHGIHADDLTLVLERHSTSKLAKPEDLYRVLSLGFRGEALGAIASVSRFSIQTASESDGQGTCLETTGSKVVAITPVAHKRGTTVEVRDLFFNTPARRKFLRAEWTEYQHIQNVIRRVVLSHFEITFTVYHNGRRVMHFPAASTDYERRVTSVMGKLFSKNVHQVDASNDSMRLWGWLGTPSIARNQSDRQNVYLNGRSIRDKQVNHAIRIAYADRIYPGRYPCYALFLEMAPQLVDINVHPAKYEVRFSQARDVHDFIHASLSQSLNESPAHNRNAVESVAEMTAHELSGKIREAVNEQAGTYKRNEYIYSVNNEATELGTIRCILHGRFLILESTDGVTLMDLFAARKKLAEKSLDDVKSGRIPENRALLFPVRENFSSDLLDQIEDDIQQLSKFGINISRQGPDVLNLKQLPYFLKNAEPAELLKQLVRILGNKTYTEAEIAAVLLDHLHDNAAEPEETEIRHVINSISNSDNAQLLNQTVWRTFDEQGLLSLLLKK